MRSNVGRRSNLISLLGDDIVITAALHLLLFEGLSDFNHCSTLPIPSGSAHPRPQSGPIIPLMKRHLAIMPMKPPFASPDDYHRFSSGSVARRLADQEPEGHCRELLGIYC